MTLTIYNNLAVGLSKMVADALGNGAECEDVPWEIKYEIELILLFVYLEASKKGNCRHVYIDCLDKALLRKSTVGSVQIHSDVWMFADDFGGHVVCELDAELVMPADIAANKPVLTLTLTPLKKVGTDHVSADGVQQIVSDRRIDAEVFAAHLLN